MIQGAKKGAEQGRKPNIQKDTTTSTSFFKGLYGLSEGEISGLVDGGKSIRLNGTPLINENGQDNFGAVKWQFRTGTLDQEHISGFPSVENYIRLGVELRHDRPFTRAINNPNLSAVRINLQWGRYASNMIMAILQAVRLSTLLMCRPMADALCLCLRRLLMIRLVKAMHVRTVLICLRVAVGWCVFAVLRLTLIAN